MITSVSLSGTPGGGRGIKIAATATPGTTVHTTGTSSSTIDEVWAWATNTDPVDKKLTIEFGGQTSPDDLIEITIPAESGLVPILPGLRLSGTGGAGRSVTMFAATTNVINIFGHVNRIT